MDHFGVDFDSMSDNALLEYITTIAGKLAYASRFSGSGEMIQQLQALRDHAVMASRDRALKSQFDDLMKRQKAIVESDPIEGLSPTPKEEPKKKLQRRPLTSSPIRRSDTPYHNSEPAILPNPPKE